MKRILCDCYGAFLVGVGSRAVHSGGQRGQLPPPGILNFLSIRVFKFTELFLVSILVRNHKKINYLTEKNLPSM